MTEKTEEQMYAITESELKKLEWNCGSASPAMHDIGPIVRSSPLSCNSLNAQDSCMEQQPASHCDQCDHWDMCEGCPYTDERSTAPEQHQDALMDKQYAHDWNVLQTPDDTETDFNGPVKKFSNLCTDCKTRKSCGSLPCVWQADIEIAAMKLGSPRFIIVDCEHYKKIAAIRQGKGAQRE